MFGAILSSSKIKISNLANPFLKSLLVTKASPNAVRPYHLLSYIIIPMRANGADGMRVKSVEHSR